MVSPLRCHVDAAGASVASSRGTWGVVWTSFGSQVTPGSRTSWRSGDRIACHMTFAVVLASAVLCAAATVVAAAVAVASASV